MKFKDLKVGDANVKLYALVVDCKTKQTVNQTPYFGLTISDGTDTADARIWSVGIAQGLKNGVIENGNVYRLTVKVNDYAGKNQIIISSIEDIVEGEVELSDFIRTAPVGFDQMKQQIKNAIASINNPILKKIVVDIFGKNGQTFFEHYAAITMHHNYLGGLAYHVCSMLNLGEQIIKNYPYMNRDLLISGILIHDIGKTKEITTDKSPVYSKDGNLLGHIVIGLMMLEEVIRDNDFEETEEALALKHMIAAHHGELEYGSPKEPLIAEALALHLIDLMDSKLAGVGEAVNKTEKGNYTQPIPTLSKKCLYVPNVK